MDFDAIWQVHLWGPMTHCVKCRVPDPQGKGRFGSRTALLPAKTSSCLLTIHRRSALTDQRFHIIPRYLGQLLWLSVASTCDWLYRYNILVYLITFVLSWVVFALLWWALQSWHGGAGVSCVDGVDGFTSALLFSIETQHTIGYGSRAVTDTCSGALTLLMVQSVFGAITQCVITGIIFAKVQIPPSSFSPWGRWVSRRKYNLIELSCS